ncbi:AcrB/AcrD/AcrF family protein [Methanolapillus ohkumae]|uniref:Uncharacterized protein n=1 Tax=Methanolapillus ohkumae TaxID=3028298 RepID=A0AA96V600_9EURY|nr:hypothetical protein MsAm2_02770 [Methanosarcinaceae archaeon Am2]
MSTKSTTQVSSEKAKKDGVAMQVFDIIFVFALAFACVVIPVYLKGATIVGDGGSGALEIIWNPVGYFSTLIVILIFFLVILFHSVKNYDY